MTYRGTFRNGVVVFDSAPAIKEGQEVRIKAMKVANIGKRGAAASILNRAGTWVGGEQELRSLLSTLNSDKAAEVAMERARLGLPSQDSVQ